MRKGIYLFLTVLIVACSGSDDSSDDVSNGATLNVKLYDIDNSDINNPNQEINLNTTLSLIQIGCNFSADFFVLQVLSYAIEFFFKHSTKCCFDCFLL